MNDVNEEYSAKVRSLTPPKALVIGMYGESVASYRYRTLAEKVPSEHRRSVFMEMADEERGHHEALSKILQERFPGSDFVLTPQDKALVIVGPRMIEVTDAASANVALDMIYESERLTGNFYRALHECTPFAELKPFLQEMADECFEHAQRLTELRLSE